VTTAIDDDYANNNNYYNNHYKRFSDAVVTGCLLTGSSNKLLAQSTAVACMALLMDLGCHLSYISGDSSKTSISFKASQQ